MKNYSKNHLTERWRDLRNLYDTDDSIDVNLNNDHKMQQMQLSQNANIFPTQLRHLVSDCEINAIVWNDQGDGIITRRLRRDKPKLHHYFHPYFKRNQPDLLPLLRRGDLKCSDRMKDDTRTHLTERWRDHRNLDDTDLGQHKGSSLITGFVPCHDSNQDGDIDTIVWNQQGDGIIINKDLMEKEFLSLNYFEASSSSSFGRQLNLYGFKKSRPFIRDKPNIHHYFHPNFNLNFFPF
ncbi:Heat shock transcription factor, X-linked member 3 [Takifugu flavidus]|uniref:Heat shock transcription factor, X-linked member 3 n=1 Tax=Takifugu flavidus TaxID=433684 RepID=A0A5C6P040_9TELE|nr:Heat shock transcription factor, X-linked member 3 [Takifugu flavidus]